MVHFFTFNDLRLFTSQAIESKDLLAANMYLDLLVKKLEILPKSLSTADHKKRVSNMLQTLLQYSMFAAHPKILLAYYASMFNRKQNEALLLDKLGVWQLIHGKDFSNKKFTEIPRADIHQDLKGCSIETLPYP
ncbi:hypothetical protein ACNR90_002758 [Candidozyma auris]